MNRIDIDFERCKGCYLCISACPKHLIEEGTELNGGGYYPARTSSGQTCTACALCAIVCPDVAIVVWKDVEAAAPAPKREEVASSG